MSSDAPRPVGTVRLKGPGGWTTLPLGRFEVGRSAHCHVVLDGGKVSRLHAHIVVGIDGARVFDAGSANGVFVNGRRVSGAGYSLEEGDALVIGEFELLVSYRSEDDGEGFGSMRPTLVGRPPQGVTETNLTPVGAVTTKAGTLDLLGSVAERAIAAGDSARAEAMLSGRLREVLDGVRQGRKADILLIDQTIRLALALARARTSSVWLDFAIELLAALRSPASEQQARDLELTATRVPGLDPRKLAAYEKSLEGLPSSLPKLQTLRLIDQLRGTPRKT